MGSRINAVPKGTIRSKKQIAAEKRIEREIGRTLKEAERVQSIPYPLDHKDKRLNLDNAHSRKENAVRGSVITINLAMEDMLDDLLRRFFLGYRPGSKKRRRLRGKRAKELDELLVGPRALGFEAKIRLARIIGLITKRQAEKLGQLNKLRNKCSHHWLLNVNKRKKRVQKAAPLLEYKGRSLFEIANLESLYKESGPVYISMFEKLLSR